MIRLIFCFMLSSMVISPIQSPAQQIARMTEGGYGYLEKLPFDYATNTTKKYPLLIFLHGLGETGNGSPADLARVKAHGPPQLIENGSTMCFTVNGVQECFIVISPQLPSGYGGWWTTVLAEIFNYVLNGPQNYRIDRNRVYLTGLSLGGQGVYTGVGDPAIPDIFAAGAPVAGFGNVFACNIASRNIPMWGFHGTSDGTISYSDGFANFDAMRWCNPAPVAELKWTSYPGVGHNAWDNAYTTDHSVQSPLNLYEWLLTKTKATKANVLPIANAGADQTTSLASASINLIGSGSDSDGTITGYNWTKVSGPAVVLTNSNTSVLGISGFSNGVYVFRLTVTDNAGATANDDVTVTVSSSANLALGRPTVTSSIENVSLSGVNAMDGSTTTRWSSQFRDGEWIYVDLGSTMSISRVKIIWETAAALNYKIQVSDDASTWTDIKTITGNNTLTDDLTGLTGSGRYVRMFGSARKTQYGFSIYEFEIYGIGGNAPPSANAGLDQAIYLPTNSVNLVGSGSDADGTITAFQWSLVSGPPLTIPNATNSTVILNGLLSGSYVFRLTVTDNLGATASDDVSITVNQTVGNLAMGKTTFTSSTEEPWSLAGNNAVDGNTSSRWSSQFSDAQWIYVDLGSSANVNRVKIVWEYANALNYKIQVSDDAIAWTDLQVVNGNASLTNDFTGLNGAGRYVRMLGVTRRTVYGYSIYEFEIYGSFTSSAMTAAARTTTTQPSANLVMNESPIDEKIGLTFLERTYLGEGDYSVRIFNKDGSEIFNGKWNIDLYNSTFSEAGLYYFHILKSGLRIDSGKLAIVNNR